MQMAVPRPRQRRDSRQPLVVVRWPVDAGLGDLGVDRHQLEEPRQADRPEVCRA